MSPTGIPLSPIEKLIRDVSQHLDGLKAVAERQRVEQQAMEAKMQTVKKQLF